MTRTKRALLLTLITGAVVTLGCGGKSYIQRERDAANERWAVSRAEMVTRLAEGHFRRGELARARKHVDEALLASPPYAPLYVLASRLAAEQNRLDDARNYAETATATDPELAGAWYTRGTIEQLLAQPQDACDAFAKAAELEPEKPAYVLAQAELLVAIDHADQAVVVLTDAAARMPGAPEIHEALGDVLALVECHHEAAVSYRTAIRLDPTRADLRRRLATALHFAGDAAEADGVLARVLDDAAGGPPPEWALRMRSDGLLALGRVDEARTLLQRLADTDADAPIGLAQCDILQNRTRAARDRLEAALRTRPDHAQANGLLGYVLIVEGRPAEAVPHLRLALKDPDCEGRKTIEQLLARALDDTRPETQGPEPGTAPSAAVLPAVSPDVTVRTIALGDAVALPAPTRTGLTVSTPGPDTVGRPDHADIRFDVAGNAVEVPNRD